MKKKLLTAALLTVTALTLVVASVLGTIAYLTATAGVANTFTVGDIAISMTETAVNPDGTAKAGAERTDMNSYHLVPGNSYIKDPTIFIGKNLSQEDDMYLFVKSRNDIRAIEVGNQADATTEEKATSMRAQMEANGWVPVLRSEDGIEIIWVYGTRVKGTGVIKPTAVNKDSVQGDKEETEENKGKFVLCETFTVDKNADVKLYNGASVTFYAFAIQTSGVTKMQTGNPNEVDGQATLKASWEAIEVAIPHNSGITNGKNPYDASADRFAAVAGKDFNLGN